MYWKGQECGRAAAELKGSLLRLSTRKNWGGFLFFQTHMLITTDYSYLNWKPLKKKLGVRGELARNKNIL